MHGLIPYSALRALLCDIEITWLFGSMFCAWLSKCVSGLFALIDDLGLWFGGMNVLKADDYV